MQYVIVETLTLLAVILQQFKNKKKNGIKLSTGVSLVDVLTQ